MEDVPKSAEMFSCNMLSAHLLTQFASQEHSHIVLSRFSPDHVQSAQVSDHVQSVKTSMQFFSIGSIFF